MRLPLKSLFKRTRKTSEKDNPADLIRKGVCPNCGCSDKWLLGPRGGLARNIKCDNCGEVYNVTPLGVEWKDRLYYYKDLR